MVAFEDFAWGFKDVREKRGKKVWDFVAQLP